MIKALFFDLDGTLLTSSKKISDLSFETLRTCKEKGIYVFVVTARAPMLDVMLGWDERVYSLLDGGIYCNGACIQYQDTSLYSLIAPDIVEKCVECVAKYPDVHMALHLEEDDHAFNYALPDDMLVPWGLKREEVCMIDASCFAKSVKILIYSKNLVDNELVLPSGLYKEIEEICQNSANVYLLDQGKTIQVIDREVNKYTSVEYIRERLGLSRDEIVVFGDGENDIDMLSLYPNSVAMGNASDPVKEIAKYITLSNDEEGISYAIHDLLEII
ncbi:MAG: HAD family hydrolase [Erysipelotrichales bacterium]|nr:HAD family hydrolase [Erysipelotrichales bacterium]